MTTPAGTLREFEQRLLSQRTDAASRESMEAYFADLIPDGLAEKDKALIMQGFENGFIAAMARVRMTLFTMQADVNREARGWAVEPKAVPFTKKEGS